MAETTQKTRLSIDLIPDVMSRVEEFRSDLEAKVKYWSILKKEGRFLMGKKVITKIYV